MTTITIPAPPRSRAWVCAACGRIGDTRDTLWEKDAACGSHAVEVWKDSIVYQDRDPTRARKADAVREERA
jgi:hypothetical protein